MIVCTLSLQALGEIAGVLKAMLDKRVRLCVKVVKSQFAQLDHLQLIQYVQVSLSCHHQIWYGQLQYESNGYISHQGNEVIVYLQNDYLPSLNVPPHLIQVKVLFMFIMLTVYLAMWCGYRLCIFLALQVILQQVQQAEVKTLKPYLKVVAAKTNFLVLSDEFTIFGEDF